MRTLAGLLILLATGTACAQSPPHAEAVAFWTSGYAGADIAGGDNHCPAPALPAISTAYPPPRGVRKAILDWETCHAGYLAGLRATPAASRIPAAVLAAMTPHQRARALAHVGAVQARVMAAAQADGAALAARHASWLGARVERLGPARPIPK
ncbi:hypothetical protein [Massilia sp. GCM10023247]|uniref:hypothetical protein n=1 Tax=Massilia sp. GCM10023247 TaxID=3252643 RepID=UPI00361693A7